MKHFAAFEHFELETLERRPPGQTDRSFAVAQHPQLSSSVEHNRAGIISNPLHFQLYPSMVRSILITGRRNISRLEEQTMDKNTIGPTCLWTYTNKAPDVTTLYCS